MMTVCRSVLIVMTVLTAPVWGQMTTTSAPVTVWYERVYVLNGAGEEVRKVVTVPWSERLTLMHAIAMAGGYSTPPTRTVFLARDGTATEQNMRHPGKEGSPDPHLLPGDLIELRATRDRTIQGQAPITGMRFIEQYYKITNEVQKCIDRYKTTRASHGLIWGSC